MDARVGSNRESLDGCKIKRWGQQKGDKKKMVASLTQKK